MKKKYAHITIPEQIIKDIKKFGLKPTQIFFMGYSQFLALKSQETQTEIEQIKTKLEKLNKEVWRLNVLIQTQKGN